MKSIHDPRYHEFILRLVGVRLARGFTQEQLAVVLRRPQSYVAKIESCDRRLDIVELRDWLIALEIAPVDFMNGMKWWEWTA